MKAWVVTIPIRGNVHFEVDANSEVEAIVKAWQRVRDSPDLVVSTNGGPDRLDWTALPQAENVKEVVF